MTPPSNGRAIYEAARDYAARGWPVLPLVPYQKIPLTSAGVLDATTNVDIIDVWWTRWPSANVGLRTGVVFDVLDIDGDTGWESLKELTAHTQHIGPVSITGRGAHWLYASDSWANRANLLPKLDWRGVNGYIVAPPSIHPDGHAYHWATANPYDLTIPQIPDWLIPHLVEWKDRTTYEPKPVRILHLNPYGPKGVHAKIVDSQRMEGASQDIVAAAHELGYNPRRNGQRYVINCIFHAGDNEASLTLYPNDNSFYCYGCGAWGDTLNLRTKRPGGQRA